MTDKNVAAILCFLVQDLSLEQRVHTPVLQPGIQTFLQIDLKRCPVLK